MKKLTSLLLTTLMLTACGWHLRGSMDLPDNLNSIYVSSANSYDTLTRNLTQAIVSTGTSLATSKNKADYTITLLDQRETRRAVSLGGNGLASEYELTLEVDYRLDHGNKLLSALETARTSRSYDYDQNAVLGKSEEEKIIREELNSELTRQILRRLQFLVNPPK